MLRTNQSHTLVLDYYYKRRTPTKLSRQGMQAMVDHLQTSTPRPKSPAMNNEEPIELAHYPDAKKPTSEEIPRIERDDFPAPPVSVFYALSKH